MNHSKIAYMVASFGWGAGLAATIIGIANGNFFILYIGLICFISNWLTSRDYLKRLI